jgi:hypothetical protein
MKLPPLLAAPLAVALVTLATSPLWAQSAPTDPSPSSPAQLERFEVTGSLIKRTDVEGPSPVRFITREEIDLSGMDNLTDIMRDMPEATNLGINEGGTTSFVRGASAIDLRFLGPDDALVLVDGRRQAPNGISSGGTVFVDLDRIPVSLIERVEILKDGASAALRLRRDRRRDQHHHPPKLCGRRGHPPLRQLSTTRRRRALSVVLRRHPGRQGAGQRQLHLQFPPRRCRHRSALLRRRGPDRALARLRRRKYRQPATANATATVPSTAAPPPASTPPWACRP